MAPPWAGAGLNLDGGKAIQDYGWTAGVFGVFGVSGLYSIHQTVHGADQSLGSDVPIKGRRPAGRGAGGGGVGGVGGGPRKGFERGGMSNVEQVVSSLLRKSRLIGCQNAAWWLAGCDLETRPTNRV